MNMNLKQQSVGETTYLVWNIEDVNLRIDSFAMNMMSYNHILNIVPTQVVQMDDRRQAQFNITGLTKVNSAASAAMPKKEVLMLFNSILNAFDEVEAYMLDPGRVLLDWEYVYLDRQGNCMFLYLPFDGVPGRDKIDFLQEVVSRIKPDYQEKDNYLYDILNAFSRGAVQTPSDFRELVKKSAGTLTGRRVGEQSAEVSKIQPEQPRSAARETQKKDEKTAPAKKALTNSRLPVMNIPGREPGAKAVSKEPVKKKKNQFSFMIPKKQKETKADTSDIESKNDTAGFRQETPDTCSVQHEMYERYEDTVIGQAPAEMLGKDEGTVFLSQDCARLIRNKSGVVYPVEGSRVILGSGTSADICIDCNNTISRSHAFIHCLNGQYYLEDNQSKNGSFINGVRLQAGTKAAIGNGMTIRLSNEEFVFMSGYR